jgi:hypothetical protein
MATTYSNNTDRIFANTQVVTGAIALTPADSGKTIFLNAAGGGAVTLPALYDGLQIKFVIGATNPTTSWVLTGATAAKIQGSLVVAGATVAAVDMDAINFIASTAVKGDYVEITSDGVNYYVSGVGKTTGAITATT